MSIEMASFKSFLSAFGKDFKGVFAWLGSAQGQAEITGLEADATAITTAFNPAAGAALAGVETLFNTGLKQVISIEAVAAAAGAQSGTGAQKSAAVVSAIAPDVSSFLLAIGVSKPTAAQVQSVSTSVTNGIVGILNALPAPGNASTTAAPPVAPASTIPLVSAANAR
jgi:hypothetical protein